MPFFSGAGLLIATIITAGSAQAVEPYTTKPVKVVSPSITAPVSSNRLPKEGPERAKVIYDTYIIGPGDTLQIELLDIPEFSGNFSIGPDGTIYLPRLRALYVEGLTIEELRYFLTQQFKAYVRSPEIYIRPVGYRAVRVYIGGEVKRPGFYRLSGSQELGGVSTSADTAIQQSGGDQATTRPGVLSTPGSGTSTFGAFFPTLFDAIRTAQGITPYSDLSQVSVTRRQPVSAGGGESEHRSISFH